jgi:hypothetical protein
VPLIINTGVLKIRKAIRVDMEQAYG